jgi:hypothetical protein
LSRVPGPCCELATEDTSELRVVDETPHLFMTRAA